nr:hypothetical protein GCM10020092_055040 [Actinoplanes digitatis]
MSWPSEGVVTPALETTRIREIWSPQQGDRAFVHDGAETFEVYDATPNGAYANLPVEPKLLLRRIYAETETEDTGPEADYSAFDWIGSAMHETILPPRTYVTLYRTAARIPGVVLVDDAVDGAGRHGTAVAFEHLGERREWIFDPRTFDYLGERSYLVEDGAERYGRARSPASAPYWSVRSSTARASGRGSARPDRAIMAPCRPKSSATRSTSTRPPRRSSPIWRSRRATSACRR